MGFGLLHQNIPAFSIFNTLAPISHFSFFKSFIASALHLFFVHTLVLTPVGFWSVIFLSSFISSILLWCPHHFNLCAFKHLIIPSPFINFYNLLLLLILHPSLHWIGSNNFLNICLSKTNKLLMSHAMSRICMRRSLLPLSLPHWFSF